MLMHVYVQIRPSCNPPPENPGYGPDNICKVSTERTNYLFIYFFILLLSTVEYLQPQFNTMQPYVTIRGRIMNGGS